MRALLAVLIVLVTHEGEEFMIALPVVMMGVAFFLIRWSARKDPEDEDNESIQTPAPSVDIEGEVAGWGQG